MSLDLSIITSITTSVFGLGVSIANLLLVKSKKKNVILKTNGQSVEQLKNIYDIQSKLESNYLDLKIKGESVKNQNIKVYYDDEKNITKYTIELDHAIDAISEHSNKYSNKKNHNEGFKKIITTTAAIISLESGLKSITKLIESGNKKEKNEIGLVISTLYLNEKLRSILKGFYLTLFGSVFFLIISMFYYDFIIPTLIISVTFGMIYFYQWILKFRIENGLFGTNHYEAKQLLTFIISNEDKFDGGRKVFNKEKLDELVIEIGEFSKGSEVKNGV